MVTTGFAYITEALIILSSSYPQPRVDESLDFLARGKFLSTLDLAQGY